MQFDLLIKLDNGPKSLRQQPHTSLYMSDTYLLGIGVEKEITPSPPSLPPPPRQQRTTAQGQLNKLFKKEKARGKLIRLQRIRSLSYTHRFCRSAPRLLSEVEIINY